MNTSLVLHCGAQDISRDDLRLIPAPESTKTWFPVMHSTVLDAVEGTLDRSGFSIVKSRLSVSKEGTRFFGVLDLHSQIGPSENLSIGIRNSNDKSFPIGFCCGTRTFVCDNLAAEKGVRYQKCKAHEGPFRLLVPDPFFSQQKFPLPLDQGMINMVPVSSMMVRTGVFSRGSV